MAHDRPDDLSDLISDLPPDVRDQIAAAEIEADSILKDSRDKANKLTAEAYRMGVDPSGVGFSPGDTLLHLAGRELAEGQDRAAGHLFGAIAGEYLKHRKLDTEAFDAKLESIRSYVTQKYQPSSTLLDNAKQDCRAVAFRRRAAALRADRPSGAESPSSTEVGPTVESAEPKANAESGEPPNLREAFVTPILKRKGWSILDWANESNVDFKTASHYLKEITTPYASTLKKLAASLGVDVNALPK